MDPWIGKTVLLLGLVASVIIRIPHDRRNKTVAVAQSRKGPLEKVLLSLTFIGFFFLPIAFVLTSWLDFADYPLRQAVLIVGTAMMVLALWLFHRAHADLGTNWSVTLKIRESHVLVTDGIYRRVRHPMYSALFAYAIAQTLLLPNWLAGPAALVAFTIMFSLRVGPEERMMLERFGESYAAYARRTKRVIPGVW